ncbi:hypothetical protein KDA14_05060, partial [Candidatus Saccharibacteria bacterium]|nr:hypothetical protein [Candidatus Saccharibacteria bacterium]
GLEQPLLDVHSTPKKQRHAVIELMDTPSDESSPEFMATSGYQVRDTLRDDSDIIFLNSDDDEDEDEEDGDMDIVAQTSPETGPATTNTALPQRRATTASPSQPQLATRPASRTGARRTLFPSKWSSPQ